METENIHETGRLRDLLGTALQDVELDGDVVPGVLGGYHRHVTARRFQAVGGTLAVLAVAAAVTVLPAGAGRPGGGRVGPGQAGAPTPATDLPNSGCHQHWDPYQAGAPVPTPPKPDPVREQAFCDALTAAVLAGAPEGATFSPLTNFGDLRQDRHIDEKLFAQYMAAFSGLGSGQYPTSPAFSPVYAEMDRLRHHPEDPQNKAMPGQFVLATSAGRTVVTVRAAVYADPHPKDGDDTAAFADCAGAKAGNQGYGTCVPVTVGGWHGAVDWGPKNREPNYQYILRAVLTDGKNHYLDVSDAGTVESDWTRLDSYTKDDIHADGTNVFTGVDGTTFTTLHWKNVWTGEIVAKSDSFPPKTPAVTPQQFAAIVGTPRFGAFLDKALPAYANWTK